MPSPSLLCTRLLPVALTALAAAVGCSKDGGTGSVTDATTTGTTSSTTTSSTTTGGTAMTSSAPTEGTAGDYPAECACLNDGCGPSICPVVAAGCPVDCPADFEVDEAALTCALEALRDGTPGTLAWTYAHGDPGVEDAGWISILADRMAIQGGSFDMIVCSGTESTIHGPLPGPEVYEACLADPSPAARFDCARQILAAIGILCAPGSGDCD